MKAILKKVQLLKSPIEDLFLNQITLYFAKSNESQELYPFRTSVSLQFPQEGYSNIDFLESKEAINNAIKEAENSVGSYYEVNLYDITVEELTGGMFSALKEEFITNYVDYGIDEDYDTEWRTTRVYHRASYKSKEDVIKELLFTICQFAADGRIIGIDNYGQEKEFTYSLIKEASKPEVKINVSYNNHPEVTYDFLKKDADVDKINKGLHLAAIINGHKANELDNQYFINLIKSYRDYLAGVHSRNTSLLMTICFWKSKEPVKDLEEFYSQRRGAVTYSEFLKIIKDSYIAALDNIKECEDADAEAMQLDMDFIDRKLHGGHEDCLDSDWKNFLKEQGKKYKGRNRIQKLS